MSKRNYTHVEELFPEIEATDNAIRAADRLECIKPLSGEKPSQLQKKPSILQTMREQNEKVKAEPQKGAPAKDAER